MANNYSPSTAIQIIMIKQDLDMYEENAGILGSDKKAAVRLNRSVLMLDREIGYLFIEQIAPIEKLRALISQSQGVKQDILFVFDDEEKVTTREELMSHELPFVFSFHDKDPKGVVTRRMAEDDFAMRVSTYGQLNCGSDVLVSEEFVREAVLIFVDEYENGFKVVKEAK